MHDGLACVRHVGDDAVCQDQQDEVFLWDGEEFVGGREEEGGGREEYMCDEFYVLKVASCRGLI